MPPKLARIFEIPRFDPRRERGRRLAPAHDFENLLRAHAAATALQEARTHDCLRDQLFTSQKAMLNDERLLIPADNRRLDLESLKQLQRTPKANRLRGDDWIIAAPPKPRANARTQQ